MIGDAHGGLDLHVAVVAALDDYISLIVLLTFIDSYWRRILRLDVGLGALA